MDDVVGLKEAVKSRLASAFVGTATITFLALNWKAMVYLFSSGQPFERIEKVQELLNGDFNSTVLKSVLLAFCFNLVVPVIAAAFQFYQEFLLIHKERAVLRYQRKLLNAEVSFQNTYERITTDVNALHVLKDDIAKATQILREAAGKYPNPHYIQHVVRQLEAAVRTIDSANLESNTFFAKTMDFKRRVTKLNEVFARKISKPVEE